MDADRHQQFAQRMVRSQQRVFAYIVSLVPNRADAEELFQQTCLTLWEHWERYDMSLDFVPWACGIAHNHVRNFLRKRQNSQIQLDADVLEMLALRSQQMQQRESDRAAALRECLKELTERNRVVIENYYGGRPVAEIATIIAVVAWLPPDDSRNLFVSDKSDAQGGAHLPDGTPPTDTGEQSVPLALLVDQAGVVFAEGRGPNGVRFDRGDYRLLEGVVHLHFTNGADLVIQAPAEFEIEDEFHTRLHSGRVRGIVPPAARGFTIETSGIDFEDVGTEFAVHADATGASAVHVLDGQVNVRRAGADELLQSVSAGESVSYRDGEISERPVLDPDAFPTPGHIGFLRWQEQRPGRLDDPGLIAWFTFDRDSNHSVLTNAVRSSDVPDGRIEGARWVSGRWPGKDALLFDRDDDFVGLTIPGEYDEFTFSFWVKVDRLDYEYNALLNSDAWDLGDLHFQIKRTGLVWANVNGKKRSPPRFAGDPIKLGRWQHIVGVISRTDDTFRTYVNGELVWEQQSRLTSPVVPGACSLGNWIGIPEKYQPTHRTLKGRMDEVAIWNRSLTKQEIKAHYEAGRPSLLDN